MTLCDFLVLLYDDDPRFVCPNVIHATHNIMTTIKLSCFIYNNDRLALPFIYIVFCVRLDLCVYVCVQRRSRQRTTRSDNIEVYSFH